MPAGKYAFFRKVVSLSFFGYLLCSIFLYFLQELLIFPVLTAQLFGVSFVQAPPPHISIAEVRTPDGETLQGWTTFNRATFPNPHHVGVIFHGNAETIHAGNFLPMFLDQGVPAYTFDYRGYGSSTGWPSEQRLKEDAVAIWNHIQSETGLAPDRAIILGNSLGTGIASHLARSITPKALILIAPYASIPHVVRGRIAYRPFQWLLRYNLSVLDDVASLRSGEIIIAHGKSDNVIPFENFSLLTEQLHRNKHVKVTPLVGETAGHDDIYYEVEGKLKEKLREAISR